MKGVEMFLFALFGILHDSHVNNQVTDDVEMTRLWPDDTTIPYEISNQFNGSEPAMIKSALVEIMKSTCIKLVPRRKKEDDYIVFMEYKALSQPRGTCWSGKSENLGSEMGYQRGRHIISLWRDLGCFNKFNIIYEVLRILGFSPNSTISGKIYKLDRAGRRDHGPYIRDLLLRNYEKPSLGGNDSTTYLRISCDKDLDATRRHPFAFDINFKKPETFIGKNPCNQLENNVRLLSQENVAHINELYECNQTNAEKGNVSDTCRDEEADCKNWADVGECETMPEYMLSSCRSSCNKCRRPGNAAAVVPCIDENENCPWWADIGECHNNPNYMLANCRYSCKQCDDGDPDELGCKDFFTEDCPKWAAIDLCKRDSWVAKYCRVSCKQKCVKRKSSKPVLKMETLELMDRATLLSLPPVSPDCAAEVVEGTCESDPDYVKAICNNNNTICEKANMCHDKDKFGCPALAFKGDCEKNPKFMQNICKGSCNAKCCTDSYARCGLWASKGHCVLKPGEMLVNCKRSCRNCEFCKDRSNDCASLAEAGECTKNPNYMTLYCPKSCKICG